jgi:RNA polymerase sigma-70 factor (ECF subfamily)
VTPLQAFDTYSDSVFRFAWRLTRRADLAEDIAQECFLALVRAPGRFDPSRGTLKKYLFAIARNLVLNHYRDERPEAPLPDLLTNPSPDLDLAVSQAVAALSSLQQEALVLFEYEGFTLEEIAEITGADIGAVKSRLHRARERLKRMLAPCRRTGDAYGTPGRS